MNAIITQLLTTFEGTFSTTFARYFHGLQKVVAQDDLPILMVYPIRTAQKHSGTLRDSVEYSIGVQIQVNLKSYYDNEAGQGTVLDSLAALENLVEERESDGDLQTDTVMGILNANLTIGSKVLYTDLMECDYTITEVGNDVQRAKVDIVFTAYDRPNRV